MTFLTLLFASHNLIDLGFAFKFFVYLCNCTSTMIISVCEPVFYDVHVFSNVYHYVMLCMNFYNRWRIFHSTCTLQLSTVDSYLKRVSQDQL